MTINAPSYSGRPIGSITALARALGVDEAHLHHVAGHADHLYHGPIVVEKPGKKSRETFAPSGPLLDVQRRILDRILRKASCPAYLLGGVPGRSYIQNAQRHAGKKVVFGQDIEGFFPSITQQRIESIFKDIFRFHPEVAALLGRLCCRHGTLVQGAPTSNDLGNLALYREEPQLEQFARDNGFEYTRFVDDIHLSSQRRQPPESFAPIVRELRSTLERLGHRPKRAKQFIATPRQAMRVHGLNVNTTASVPSERRKALRNEVFRLERRADTEIWNESLEATYRSLCVRVGNLTHTNPGDARRLKARLNALPNRRSA